LVEGLKPDGAPNAVCRPCWAGLIGACVAAGLINATLITTCLLLLWFLELVGAIMLRSTVQSGTLNWMLGLLALVTPVFAPVVYRILWHLNRRERSLGEQWLALNWAIDQKVSLLANFFELKAGLVASSVAFAAQYLSGFIINTCSGSAGHPHDVHLWLAQSAILLLAYSYSLAIVLISYYLRKEKSHSACDSASSCILKKVATLGHVLVMLLVPVALCIVTYFLTPAYYALFCRDSLAYLILLLLLFWWVAGLLIVRYWNSPKADFFYLSFFVIPGVIYFTLLPSLIMCITIRPPNDI
jgi:hypothetical protein